MPEKKLRLPFTAWFKWTLRLLVGIGIVVVLVRWKGAGVQAALAQTSWQSLIIAVFFYLTSQLISAWKWKILLDASLPDSISSNSPAGSAVQSTPAATGNCIAAPNLAECFRFYLIGMFCNLWLPTSVGGDAVRAALAARRWGHLSVAISSILVERLTGLVALLAIGAAGWLFWWPEMARSNADVASSSILLSVVVVLLTAGVLGTLFFALRRLAFFLELRTSSQLIGKWAKIHRALDVFASPNLRPALFQAVALSLVFQSTQIGLNIFLAHSIGLDLSPIIYFWLVPGLAIASMIPLGIGGLGVREGAAISMLQSALPPSLMPDAATILAWSLLWQATLWLSGLPGAAAYLLQQKKRTP